MASDNQTTEAGRYFLGVDLVKSLCLGGGIAKQLDVSCIRIVYVSSFDLDMDFQAISIFCITFLDA